VGVYESSAEYRLTRAYFSLANSYVRVGQSELASQMYMYAEKHATTNIQKVYIMLERSRMLRLQQNVPDSLVPLLQCEGLMRDLKVNKGKYYYYYGNTMRDLNDFELAEEKYIAALDELISGADDFTLAELYFDYSWMEYLRSEHVNFEKVFQLLELGWELSKKRGFGTEYSEYYHIKYEIGRDLKDFEKAYADLLKALKYAKEYSNIFIILDCLNHRAQQMFAQGHYSSIPGIISEMMKYERTGCGIRVFRGRAQLVLGDVYFEGADYKRSLKEYKEGFCIVALYGNSRSNVELFSDLFYSSSIEGGLSRLNKLKVIIDALGSSAKRQLKAYWDKHRVSREFDYFIDEL